MMAKFKIGILGAGILLLCAGLCAIGGVETGSSSCLKAYNDGGAPDVFQSTDCGAQWILMAESLRNSSSGICQFASLQGHRKYQEDRVSCNLGIRIPVLEKDAIKEAKVDILAVFDGHGGMEASEMAKNHLLDYFLLHVVAGAFKKALPPENHRDLVTSVENEAKNHFLNQSFHGLLPTVDDGSLHEILKEALLGAIRDIDGKFSLEALHKKYSAGSTASVVLLLNDEEIIVANVGDSKVLLCAGNLKTTLYVEELTNDHHPGRDDERARIESAGGYVLDWDVPRVNGILALSRAIGDVFLKRYGVIAEPELTDWRNLTSKDHYLVIASDGIFESLTPQSVCDVLKDATVEGNRIFDDTFPCLPSSSMAECIVEIALQKGSTDNLSAIVVPLEQADDSLEPKNEL